MRAQVKYKIMVFSWNTESISISETLDVDSSHNKYLPGFNYNCNIPDFYPKLVQFITDNDPDLIVIGFQEDRYPGSYFHSHFLPVEMPKLGYSLVKRTKLMGIGVTTYKGLLKGDLFERGLRLSIYGKKNLVPLIEKEEVNMRNIVGNDGQDEYVCSSVITRGKGAIASYIMLPGYGRLALICCHLPFDATSLLLERKYKNKMLRQNAINKSNICFNNIIEQLVLFKDPIPTHVIYFGDFNYRLTDLRPAAEIATQFRLEIDNHEFIKDMYNNYDELKEQMNRGNIYPFLEGVDNQGPIFIPTCKMMKERNGVEVKLWETGRNNQRTPSWCDRILYRKFNDQEKDGHQLKCVYYDRFDVGMTMAKSDHAAVLALFELE